MHDLVMLVDDDATLISAIADQLRWYLADKKIGFVVCSSVDEVRALVAEACEKTMRLAVVDLWLIDKKSNTLNKDAGAEIIQLLRQRWPECYIVVLSGHIDVDVVEEFDKFENLALISKPYPTGALEEVIGESLEEIRP